MKFSQIIGGILSLIILASCSNDDSNIPAMTCKIVQKAENCSAVPTLTSGLLRIVPRGHFELKGHYSACFHDETVTIYGEYQVSEYKKGMNIELLATKIKGLKSSEFPSTIAVITLEKATLKGVMRDVWAAIRSPAYRHDGSQIEVTCKPSSL